MRASSLRAGLVFGVPAAVLALVFLVVPVAYQTLDDPEAARILQGDRILGTAPDAHCIYVHSVIGWMVSSLSTAHPSVAWYGVLMAALYALAYTAIGASLPGMAGGSSPVRSALVFLAFVAAFALLPLVLFQFTILAGLLGIAGMLPCVRLACLRDSSNLAPWLVSALSLLLGLMVRFQMAVMILASFLPLLGLAFVLDRDWRRTGSCVSYVAAMGALGLGLYAFDAHLYRETPAYHRFLEFNRQRAEYTDRVRFTHAVPVPLRTPEVARASRSAPSPNDSSMLAASMGIDSGPFRLEDLARLEDVRQVHDARPADARTAVAERDGETQQKLEGMLGGRDVRHIRLTLYLVGILGAGTALAAAAAALGAWRTVAFSGAIAGSVGALFVLGAVLLDRAVFRVLFPCAYVLLITAIVLFPWNRLGSRSSMPPWRQWVLLGAMGGFCAMGGTGVVLAGVQIGQNHAQRSHYNETIREIGTRIGTRHTIVAWLGALHVEYRSPFERSDAVPLQIYPMGNLSSHPRLLDCLKQRFGDDVYAGLARPDVAHLGRLSQRTLLKRFYAEHYGRRLESIGLGTFAHGEGRTAAWVLVDADGKP